LDEVSKQWYGAQDDAEWDEIVATPGYKGGIV
jgi:hypothetical protein